MDRRFFSARVPNFGPDPEDAATFLGKLRESLPRFAGWHPVDVATALAALLCGSLGEEVSALRSLFSSRGLAGVHEDLTILDAGGSRAIEKIVRRILQGHLQHPGGEVTDDPTLNRIGGLLASAISFYIERARREADTDAHVPGLLHILEETFRHGGVLVHIEDDRIVAEYRQDGGTAWVEIYPF